MKLLRILLKIPSLAVLLPLFFFGLNYFILSSEFWPITISRSWLPNEVFEYSVLQKPLFSLILSLFHYLPLTDVQHIYFVKALFSLIGCIGIYYYAKLLTLSITDNHNSSMLNVSAIVFALTTSPFFLNNFFKIRTDQVAFTIYCLFLLSCHRKKWMQSLFLIFLIPLIGVKEVIFLPACLLQLYACYKDEFKNLISNTKYKKVFFYGLGYGIAAFIWILSYNLSSFDYLLELIKNFKEPSGYVATYLNTEYVLIAPSLIFAFLNLGSKNTYLRYTCISSLYFFILIIVFPQSFDFFIASLAPFLYLPFLIWLLDLKTHKTLKSLSISAFVSFYILQSFTNENTYKYPTNKYQLEYISRASQILQKNNFSYLDGIGLLPRRKFIRCFYSPSDENAINTCKAKIENKSADVIIVTNRLNSLGTAYISDQLENEYTQQFLINFFLKNHLITSESWESEIPYRSSLAPLLIFQ